MKILWLSHLVPYPPKGGVLQRSYHLLRELARDNEVELMAFIQQDLMVRRFPSIEQGLREAHIALLEFCSGVTFFPIPSEQYRYAKQALALASLATPVPYTVNWLRSSRFRDAVLARAPRGFDILHADTISLVPYVDALPPMPSVLDHHNIESHMMLRRARIDRNWLHKAYFLQEGIKLQNYERLVGPRFGLHITCSGLDSERLRSVSPNIRVEEIPNGVDLDYFQPRGGEEIANRLIFVGTLNWYPNRDAMIFFVDQVWPRLKAAIPDVSMDVVGESPPGTLLALAKSDPNFHVHGFVDDVRPYLHRASVYVCPISDGGGTKLKVLDAFAMAKPMVSHPVACEGIAAQEGRHALFATSPDQWVAQVSALLGDAGLRRRIGQSARELVVERYSYRAIGGKLQQLYQGLVPTSGK